MDALDILHSDRNTNSHALQHCFEPADQGRQYRRVVAARLATQASVVVHASEYISCQLCAVADLLQGCARDARTTAFPSGSQVIV